MTKIEQIVNVCENCKIDRLREILETVCGIDITIKEVAIDRPTYVDMIEGTLTNDINPMGVNDLYNALHTLKEF